MLREIVGKVVRNTPGLRRVRDLVRGRDDKAAPTSAADAGPRFGAEAPRATPTPAPARVDPPAPAPSPVEAAPKAPQAAPPLAADPAPTAAETSTAAPSPGDAPAPATSASARKGGKKGGAKKAAAAEPAAPKPSAKEEHARKDQAEVEALRAEAERKKAEIRARKEAEAKAAAPAPAPAAGGIAAMIAQAGGKVDAVAAKANVRATSGIEWQPEDTEVHLAEDGAEYWGAIDNESSRAYARGDTLIIDQWECINCGTCVENTEHVFVLPTDAKAVVVSQEGPMDLIQDAIDACPVTCIHWTDDPTRFEQVNDAEGNPLG